MLCAVARERKVAAEGSAHETVDDDAVYVHTTTEEAVHSSFEDWCTLKQLSARAASKVIFGVDDDPVSKRSRSACEIWAARRYLDSPAVQEAAKGVRARAPSRPRPA